MLTVFCLIASLMGYVEASDMNEDITFYKAYRTAKKQPKTFYKLKPTLQTHTTTLADSDKTSLSASQLTLVNLNTATVETLQSLPYVGKKRAEAIIEYRNTLPQECFTAIDQLLEIKGISTKLLDRMRAHLVL